MLVNLSLRGFVKRNLQIEHSHLIYNHLLLYKNGNTLWNKFSQFSVECIVIVYYAEIASFIYVPMCISSKYWGHTTSLTTKGTFFHINIFCCYCILYKNICLPKLPIKFSSAYKHLIFNSNNEKSYFQFENMWKMIAYTW